MKTTQAQNLAEKLADVVWLLLEDLFQKKSQPRPPIYFFNSPKSKNSLKNRSLYEIDLVHQQQFLNEGITLKIRPQAYVSTIDQTVEETAHLFALSYQKSTRDFLSKPRYSLSAKRELWHMTLHEIFGRFTRHIVEGRLPVFKGPRPAKNLWEMAHREGYFLGGKLAESYFNETIDLRDLQTWFNMNWFSAAALHKLYHLLKQSPPSSNFLKLS